MAYLAEDDKELDPNAQSTQTGSGQQSFTGGQGGGFADSQGVSTAGVGQGGTGGWTNIQAYLKANEGNNQSADVLKNSATAAFNQDRQNVQTQATDTKSKVEHPDVNLDQASKLIDEAANNYQNPNQPKPGGGGVSVPGGGGEDGKTTDGGSSYGDPTIYNANVQKVKDSLAKTYHGPDTFGYGLSADTQNFGTGVGNDQLFQGVMNSLYNKAAGGHLGAGGLTLQNQLDVNNPVLAQTRADLKNQYQDLNDYVGNQVTDTNAAIKQGQDDFNNGHSAILDYLNQTSLNDQGELGNRVRAMKDQDAQYKNQYDTSKLWDPRLNANTYDYLGKNIEPFKGYYNFKGTDANESNVEGADFNRNRFNAIMDILGQSTKQIAPSAQKAKHGSNEFDQAAWDDMIRNNPLSAW